MIFIYALYQFESVPFSSKLLRDYTIEDFAKYHFHLLQSSYNCSPLFRKCGGLN